MVAQESGHAGKVFRPNKLLVGAEHGQIRFPQWLRWGRGGGAGGRAEEVGQRRRRGRGGGAEGEGQRYARGEGAQGRGME